MAADEGFGGEGSDDISPTVSPTSRVKFFCSYGGKILPRPSDGVLKYVGGETRVVAVPRAIDFSELLKRVNHLFEGESVLKYQIPSQDLDALVSVKSDDDLRHMLDEYDRLENEGNPKLRTFLFPSGGLHQNPFYVDQPPLQTPEQRFVDAINGIVRASSTITTTTTTTRKLPPPDSNLKSIASSPECASPHSISPTSAASATTANSERYFVNCLHTTLQARMNKAQSSPSLICTQLNSHHINCNNITRCHPCNSCCHHHQHYPATYTQSPCRHPPDHPLHQQQLHTPIGHQTATMGCAHHPPSVSINPAPSYNVNHPFASTRRYPGSGGQNKWGHLGDYAVGADHTATLGPPTSHSGPIDGGLPRGRRDPNEVAWE